MVPIVGHLRRELMVATLLAELPCTEKLGEGTSGAVYGLTDSLDGKAYAVKVVALSETPTAQQTAECRLHASLPAHEALVRYYFAWTTSDKLHILLERVDKELWDVLEGDQDTNLLERSRWATALLSAVACLHSHGIAHRDISPWNCFVAAPQTPPESECRGQNPSKCRPLKLGDFGLAVRVPPTGSPAGHGGLFGWETDGFAPLDESAIGSFYSAPELGAEGGYDGKEVDVFSCGMTLFAIFHPILLQRSRDRAESAGSATPVVPFAEQSDLTDCVERLKADGMTLPTCWLDCDAKSQPLVQLVQRMVSHEPQRRPSAAECLQLLSAALQPWGVGGHGAPGKTQNARVGHRSKAQTGVTEERPRGILGWTRWPSRASPRFLRGNASNKRIAPQVV